MRTDELNIKQLSRVRTYAPGISEWKGYTCNSCKAMYRTAGLAEQCFNQGFHPRFKRGDIVVQTYHLEEGKGDYAWFDGDPDWIFQDIPDGGLHGGRGISFYFVVTDVFPAHRLTGPCYRMGDHDPIYVVLTRGLKHLHRGWTRDDGHTHFTLAPNPPDKVVRQGRKFIGFTTQRLL